MPAWLTRTCSDARARIAPRGTGTRGYVVLDRNWRMREGEIDLVVARRGELVVVEVKTRRGEGFGHPFEAIDRRKQARRVAAGDGMDRGASRPGAGAPAALDAIAMIGADPATGRARTPRGSAVTTARTWAIALTGSTASSSRSRQTSPISSPSSASSACPTRRSAKRCSGCTTRRQQRARTSAAPAHRQPVAREPPQARDRPSTSRSRSPRSPRRVRWMPRPSRRRCTSASWGSTDACGPCPACCPRCMAAVREGKRRVIVPYANEAEAALVEGMTVIGAVALAESPGGTAPRSRTPPRSGPRPGRAGGRRTAPPSSQK